MSATCVRSILSCEVEHVKVYGSKVWVNRYPLIMGHLAAVELDVSKSVYWWRISEMRPVDLYFLTSLSKRLRRT